MEMHTAVSLREIHAIENRPVRRYEFKILDYLCHMVCTVAADYARYRRYRSGIQELSQLDDRLLADIGLTRGDIPGAARLGRPYRQLAAMSDAQLYDIGIDRARLFGNRPTLAVEPRLMRALWPI